MIRKVFGLIVRLIAYLVAFVVPVVAMAGWGYASGGQVLAGDRSSGAIVGPEPAPKPYDPTKPTVAIVMGARLTEVTDFMVPYEIFSAAGAFNVFAVAPERKPTSLKGGLDVLPD